MAYVHEDEPTTSSCFRDAVLVVGRLVRRCSEVDERFLWSLRTSASSGRSAGQPSDAQAAATSFDAPVLAAADSSARPAVPET